MYCIRLPLVLIYHKLTHLIWMCSDSVPSPLAAPQFLNVIWCPRLVSSCIRGGRNEERCGEQMRSVLTDTLLVSTVAPKLLHYNPAFSTAVTWMWTERGYSAPRWIIGARHFVRMPPCPVRFGPAGNTRGPQRVFEGCTEKLGIVWLFVTVI